MSEILIKNSPESISKSISSTSFIAFDFGLKLKNFLLENFFFIS